MTTKQPISINGQKYDPITGMPLNSAKRPVAKKTASTPAVANRSSAHSSKDIHRRAQKSTTLRRSHLASPKSTAIVNKKAVPKPTSAVKRSPMISHFASHPSPLPKNKPAKVINDIGPVAKKAVTTPKTQKTLESHEIKAGLLANASKKVSPTKPQSKKTTPKTKRPSLLKRLRRSHLVTASIAVLLLAGYVTYLNMPGISVRLAASQSGVNAKYPNYSPDGYSFDGPVAFQQGEVEMRFKSNGGSAGYTIRQRNSDWNSVAVLDNYVLGASSGSYDTSSASGITIYTYGTKAAWTNGGVLYTIEGDAPLSKDQLVHIASSM